MTTLSCKVCVTDSCQADCIDNSRFEKKSEFIVSVTLIIVLVTRLIDYKYFCVDTILYRYLRCGYNLVKCFSPLSGLLRELTRSSLCNTASLTSRVGL